MSVAGTVSKVHRWGSYAATSSQAGRNGGVCGRWGKAKAVAVGTECHRLGSVGDDEVLYMPVMAVRRKWQGGRVAKHGGQGGTTSAACGGPLYTISV